MFLVRYAQLNIVQFAIMTFSIPAIVPNNVTIRTLGKTRVPFLTSGKTKATPAEKSLSTTETYVYKTLKTNGPPSTMPSSLSPKDYTEFPLADNVTNTTNHRKFRTDLKNETEDANFKIRHFGR